MPGHERYKAMVSTAHPLATDIGIDVLRQGGNCVDAAIAVAAALNVVDMANTGIGGDMFALVFFQKEGRVAGLNASGRAPYKANIDEYNKRGLAEVPKRGPLSVTVPGALSGWVALHDRYGTMPFDELLRPAIALAKDGFEINQFLSLLIMMDAQVLKDFPQTADVYLNPDGTPPEAGSTLRQTALGESLERVAEERASVMYGGTLGEKVAKSVTGAGGFLSKKDFSEHRAEWVEPIYISYRDYEIFTVPPNSQGLALLEMLNIMEGYDVNKVKENPSDLMHLQVEAKKLAFDDRNSLICDPAFYDIPVNDLISKGYAADLRARINPAIAGDVKSARPPESADTTYFCIVDSEGNSVSFINSLFYAFGSGMVADDTGILLQNRGKGFILDPDHPNSLQPHKRPMHTLVPCMVMKRSKPFLVLGCIGGDQQTQGLLQILMNILDLGMPPQEAIDAPRWRSYDDGQLAIEGTAGAEVVQSMSARGHLITTDYDFFGGAQCIKFDAMGYMTGGSDPRLAGCCRGLP